MEWEPAGGRASRRAAPTRAKPPANSRAPTSAPQAAAAEPQAQPGLGGARPCPGGPRPYPGGGPGAEQPPKLGSPRGRPLASPPQQQKMPHGAARPAREPRPAEELAAHWRRRRCVPTPFRVPAPSAAAAASRPRLLPLREPPPSPPPPPPPLPARAQPAPAAPESSRKRSCCSRPRHERKRRRRGRRRRRLSSRGRRALPASVVVSQAGPRRARGPAPPAPPAAAAPARARRSRPPQPSGPRASPGGRPGWRRLRQSAGSRYGVRERTRRGGAWVGLGCVCWEGAQRRVVQPPGPAAGVERCPGQVSPAPEPV